MDVEDEDEDEDESAESRAGGWEDVVGGGEVVVLVVAGVLVEVEEGWDEGWEEGEGETGVGSGSGSLDCAHPIAV